MTTKEIIFYNELDNIIPGETYDPDYYETYQRLLNKYNLYDELESFKLFDIEYLIEKGIYYC